MTVQDNITIKMTRGNSTAIDLAFYDPLDDDQLIPVNGYHLKLTAKVSRYRPDNEAVISKIVALPDVAASGKYVLNLEPDDTRHLEAMTYDFDLQLASPDKSDVITLVSGKLKVSMPVSWGI